MPARDRRLLVGLVVLLPLIGAGLRLLGFRRTYRLLGALGGAAGPHVETGAGGEAAATRLGRLVDIASRRGPYTATCLRRSLALWWLLRRHALPAELRVGVRRVDGRIGAHAWVELAGRAIDDPQSDGAPYAAYRELDSRLARRLTTA